MSPATARPPIDLLQRVQGEFLEMPGLRLTARQAQRLWALDAASCSEILSTLVEGGFLFQTRDGSFKHVDQAKPLNIPLSPSVRTHSKVSAA